MKYLKAVAAFIAAEPAATISVVTAALVLLANYGLPVGGQHAQDIKDLISAALILVGGYAIRSQVTPTSRAAA